MISTGKQNWSLFLSTGVDCREAKLTKDEASTLVLLSNKDPKRVQEILISKGGSLKNPKNLERSLKRVENLGKVFDLNKIVVNQKRDKKVRNKIFKRIKDLMKTTHCKTEQKAFDSIAKILNKEGYRCCDGSQWKYKSVYDFYRRNLTKPKKQPNKSVSIDSIDRDYVVNTNKKAVLKAIFESDIESTIKVEIIKRFYL
jgi:hypothetical protein